MSIILKNVSFSYNTMMAKNESLKGISLEIHDGDFLGIIGRSGAGKSTLTKQLNGLLKPKEGSVFLDGKKITKKEYKKFTLRNEVGMVFQYPEQQLFEKTVIEDVCFGPKALGLTKEDSEAKAKKALALVGIDKSLFFVSPFELSGGEKRRVAIAGVLAMEPKILVLDEPSAGLDPVGRREILTPIKRLNEKEGVTVIMISHDIEEMVEYTNRVLVLHEGRNFFYGAMEEVFSHKEELEKIGLNIPLGKSILYDLEKQGVDLDTAPIQIDEVATEIAKIMKRRRVK